MNEQLKIIKATPRDISEVQKIVYATWPVAYKDILSDAQLKYMLQLIYSSDALQNQFNEGHQFYIAEKNNRPVGFASFGFHDYPSVYKLHKLYVLPEIQRSGAGKALVDFVIEEMKKINASSLVLNVNRHNRAKSFYERNGFKIVREEDIDIGNGYFMNDYIMELKIEKQNTDF